ncbi:MAG: TlpA family protein disulfide reductase [Gammaproteobacteria bacterium]|nr:TlpA family protein disulfide reductase [Gammaproteobacteria bacterium]NNF60819.1 TlpA family protein disulfide reductase [Gammaproteobacteria bacterium]NNM21716.1 TlpA family protein disulfide reductase [Gammaproteobacteria bacterium]
MKNILILTLAALLLGGCSGPGPVDPVQPGDWRGVLTLPGGELPFSLQLKQDGTEWMAVLVNGDERVEVTDVTVNEQQMTLVLPAFNTRIDARRDGAGFSGTLTLVKRAGKQQHIPFVARPGEEYRFLRVQPESYVDVDGRWAVTFREDDGSESEAIAEFEQTGNVVEGTFLTPTGDYRFLAGEVDGNQLYLSTFDGSHAFLFTAKLEGAQLQGDFWSGTAWHESFVARRDANAALPDADELTQLVDEQFTFSFPDTDGNMVSLDDPQFDGKVVLVALAGSWCPNCHDEAAFLAPFYHQYRDQGLEIVGLMFEHLEDFSAAATQVIAFRDKFDIGYTLLVAGSSDKQRAGETMSMLDRVYAFPTSVFIDRNGNVRRIHTGFNGPGTGRHYDQLVAGFTETIEQLLAE